MNSKPKVSLRDCDDEADHRRDYNKIDRFLRGESDETDIEPLDDDYFEEPIEELSEPDVVSSAIDGEPPKTSHSDAISTLTSAILPIVEASAEPSIDPGDHLDVDSWLAAIYGRYPGLEELGPFVSCVTRVTYRRKDHKKAPGCFGSPALLELDCAECRECRFAEGCLTVSNREKINLSKDGDRIRLRQIAAGEHPKAPPLEQEERSRLRTLVRSYHLRQHRISERVRKRRDRTKKQENRKSEDPVIKVRLEAQERRRMLLWAIKNIPHDRRLQQLRGRSEEVVSAWMARACALATLGERVSDAAVAKEFERMNSVAYSRHQARAHRQLIERLENDMRVWGRFLGRKRHHLVA